MSLENLKAGLRRGRRLLPALLILGGAGAVGVAVAADLFGIGHVGGFGAKQRTLAVAGFAVLVLGILLTTPFPRRYLSLWQAHMATDVTPASLLLIAAWFGLLAGWAEVLVWSVRRFILIQVIEMGIDFLWMTPLANLLLFVVLGISLSAVHWRWPKVISLPFSSFILAFTAFLSFLLLFPQLHTVASMLLAAGLGIQTARMIAKHPREFHKIVRFTMAWPVVLGRLFSRAGPQEYSVNPSESSQISRRQLIIGAGAAIAGMAIGVQASQQLADHLSVMSLPPPPSGLPNVLLIVLDTVRAQSLSLYGYTRRTTPNLERFAQTGVCFDRAMSTSPWTLPSHASMFTGRFPHELSTGWDSPLDSTYPTLASILSANGYVTAGFVANFIYCTPEYGLSRGFSHYEDFDVSAGQIALSSSFGRTIASNNHLRNATKYQEVLNRKTAAELNCDFLRWLSHQDRQPFFGFLNYFDAHEPYLPPEPFDVLFGPRRPRGSFSHRPIQAERQDKLAMSPEEIQVELDAYEGSIAYLDHQLGLLFDELEKRGLLENTLVIITSDHGEEFGEHGAFDHGGTLYLPALLVPLLLSFPPRIPASERISEPVTLCDLPTTVLDLLGLADEDAIPGQSLARYWNVKSDSPQLGSRMLLSEVEHGMKQMQSLVYGNLHYIKNLDDSEELYDVESDPWETQDLASSEGSRRLLERFSTSLETLLGAGSQS